MTKRFTVIRKRFVRCPHCRGWRRVEPDWKKLTTCPLCLNEERVQRELAIGYRLVLGSTIRMDRDHNQINELRKQFDGKRP